MGLRAGDGVDFKAPGIQRSGNPLDIPPFSCGIPAFIGNNQRNSFTVKPVVKLTQPFLKLIQLLLVFRFLHGFVQRDFIKPWHLLQREGILQQGNRQALVLKGHLDSLAKGLQNLQLRPFT